ncbi:ATP-binding protein [Neobacillus niacini]|uniref:ATP-binding protein n=1 Tax=Neobacillus niacini TaxID=86668 RepID=UPI0005ED854A|nr:ATP-binding protein [Neobacillus niacini]
MKRLVIITVGKTHSGKTTFARALEQELSNSLVIDQDNHAEFINTYYKKLLPKQGTNTIKYAITQTIVDYAVEQTKFHLILCNSNRIRKGRLELLKHFHEMGFINILVNFDIPEHILRKRVAESRRSKTIFRSASSFEEVLIRQQAESHIGDILEPTKDEADYLFEITNSDEIQSVIHRIVNIAQST